MTFEQLIAETVKNCKLGGYADAQPTPDFAFAVNEAYREISTETEYNWEDTTVATVIDQAIYDLNTDSATPTDLRNWIRVTDVLYGTTDRLAQTDKVGLRRMDRLWTQTAHGTPEYWLSPGPGKLRLYPKPDAVATLYIHGSREVGALASGGIPTFPIRYHEAIPLRAAWRVLKNNATGSSYQRALAYKSEALEIITKFKGELQDQRSAVFTREYVREVPERLLIGGTPYRTFNF